MKEDIQESAMWGCGFMIALFLLAFLFALPIKWLWNATLPELFNAPEITYGKALLLYWLSGLLVKSPIIQRNNK